MSVGKYSPNRGVKAVRLHFVLLCLYSLFCLPNLMPISVVANDTGSVTLRKGSSLDKLTQTKATTLRPFTTWLPYISLLTILNFQIKIIVKTSFSIT